MRGVRAQQRPQADNNPYTHTHAHPHSELRLPNCRPLSGEALEQAACAETVRYLDVSRCQGLADADLTHISRFVNLNVLRMSACPVWLSICCPLLRSPMAAHIF